MKAKKENKVYTINTEQEKQRYLKDGFDIYDDGGNLTEHSPKKKIAYSEFAKAMEEIQALKAENGQLRAAAAQDPEKKAGTKKAGE